MLGGLKIVDVVLEYGLLLNKSQKDRLEIVEMSNEMYYLREMILEEDIDQALICVEKMIERLEARNRKSI